MKKYSSKITPICIKRKDAGHLTNEYKGEIANATTIRKFAFANRMKDVKTYTTPASFTILQDEMKNGHFVSGLAPFENIIIYKLRTMPIEEIAKLPDVSEGLEHLIKKAANSCNTIDDFISIVRSKRYTETRIRRILLYSLLNVTKKDIDISKKTVPYIRVLGFNENGKHLLSKISRINPRLHLITSVKKFENYNINRNLKTILEKDILATNVYTLGYLNDSQANLDYTKKLLS